MNGQNKWVAAVKRVRLNHLQLRVNIVTEQTRKLAFRLNWTVFDRQSYWWCIAICLISNIYIYVYMITVKIFNSTHFLKSNNKITGITLQITPNHAAKCLWLHCIWKRSSNSRSESHHKLVTSHIRSEIRINNIPRFLSQVTIATCTCGSRRQPIVVVTYSEIISS